MYLDNPEHKKLIQDEAIQIYIDTHPNIEKKAIEFYNRKNGGKYEAKRDVSQSLGSRT